MRDDDHVQAYDSLNCVSLHSGRGHVDRISGRHKAGRENFTLTLEAFIQENKSVLFAIIY